MNSQALNTLQQQVLGALSTVPDNARRLFHGRGQCWPGLEQITVDWLQGVLLVSLFKELDEPELAALTHMLLALTEAPAWRHSHAHTLLLQHRYRPDSRTEFLLGAAIDQWPITENGLRFKVDIGKNQNTGFFLDMRYGRRWVQEQAQGKRVLNLFAYTCSLSVAAIAGGAEQVVNLDMAKGALSRGRDNHRLNQHDLSKVTFLGHDLFKSWCKVKKLGPYDLIIIDPPSFQKGSFELSKDYEKILRRLPGLLTAQGIVLACINNPSTGPEFLIEGMANHAASLTFSHRLDNPPEFADINPDSGLKALVFIQAKQVGVE
jgi:23S rRNA (cytosine1962-C5)-methyltransferase